MTTDTTWAWGHALHRCLFAVSDKTDVALTVEQLQSQLSPVQLKLLPKLPVSFLTFILNDSVNFRISYIGCPKTRLVQYSTGRFMTSKYVKNLPINVSLNVYFTVYITLTALASEIHNSILNACIVIKFSMQVKYRTRVFCFFFCKKISKRYSQQSIFRYGKLLKVLFCYSAEVSISQSIHQAFDVHFH